VAVGESVPVQTRAQRKAERAEPVHLHKVKAGQTLGGIAKQYKISLDALRDANNISRNKPIKPGMKLRIPASG
jgi:LysM repeat protein